MVRAETTRRIGACRRLGGCRRHSNSRIRLLRSCDRSAFRVEHRHGGPTGKDGDGFISKLDVDGKIVALKWVNGLASTRAGANARSMKGGLVNTEILAPSSDSTSEPTRSRAASTAPRSGEHKNDPRYRRDARHGDTPS